MSIDTVNFKTLTVPSTVTEIGTSFQINGLTQLTIINNSISPITISQASDGFVETMSLVNGQGITFHATDFDVLPVMKVTSGVGTTSISIIYD